MRVTGITTPGQRESGSNGYEGVIAHTPKLEPHQQRQFNMILRVFSFNGMEGIHLQRIQSAYSKPRQQGDQ